MTASTAYGWDGLGHRIVAENAALLIEDEGTEVGALLGRHRFELGVYSILPDLTFRRFSKSEAELHFFERDTPSPQGQLPKRLSQLVRMARSEWPKQVSGGFDSGNAATGDKKHAFTALFYMGILAHYSGDAVVPHHTTQDSNGFAHGLGGVHWFFEGDCVDAFEPELAGPALAMARANQRQWLTAWGKDPVMSVLDDSFKTIKTVEANDQVLEPSQGERFAKRKAAKVACVTQRALIIERLAKGAVLTAELWRRSVPPGIDWSQSKQLQFNDLMDNVTWVPFP